MSGCPFNAPQETESILGFKTTEGGFIHGASHEGRPDPTHYSSYLAVDQLLKLQDGVAACKPEGKGLMHHEEMTFIVVHQVFELWFKLVAGDLSKVRDIITGLDELEYAKAQEKMNEAISYLRRTEHILHHTLGAFGIMETMHPADFVEFRDFLVPASGFQSVSFRALEQLLGVSNSARAMVNGSPVFSYLKPEEQASLKATEKDASINDLVVDLMSRVRIPDGFIEAYIKTTEKILNQQQFDIAGASKDDPKAAAYVKSGVDKMKNMLEDPLPFCEGLALPDEEAAEKFKAAVLGTLLILSYRFEPRFAQLATLLDSLIAVEEGTLLWRSRHMHMAERMIGRRSGTGGTASGVGYLDVTRRYRIFHALWLVRKLFVRSSALPTLTSLNPGELVFEPKK